MGLFLLREVELSPESHHPHSIHVHVQALPSLPPTLSLSLSIPLPQLCSALIPTWEWKKSSVKFIFFFFF